MVILVINEIFETIKKEARQGIINLKNEDGEYPLRISFNIVDDNLYNNIPNIYIKDKEKFKKVILNFVTSALDFYSLEATEDNIKEIIAYSFANITKNEMNAYEEYLSKYIEFYNNKFKSIKGEKETSIGTVNYGVYKQSINQETPFCFKSYIEQEGSMYSLPRISFGIKDDICEIFAIQNKDSKMDTDSEYNKKVKDAFRKINSGISKYRNITPSFVIALNLFISFLKNNSIHKIKVITPLPIRQANRIESKNMRIKLRTMQGDLNKEEIEKFKADLEERLNRNEYNTTVKFVNCFNRLKLHYENLFYTNINNQMILDVLHMTTDNELLKKFNLEREMDSNGKISKHSGS